MPTKTQKSPHERAMRELMLHIRELTARQALEIAAALGAAAESSLATEGRLEDFDFELSPVGATERGEYAHRESIVTDVLHRIAGRFFDLAYDAEDDVAGWPEDREDARASVTGEC